MAVIGMTSYARVEKKDKYRSVEVMFRSVNSRFLEIHVHQIPTDKIYLEEEIKKEIKKKITRGRIEVFFFVRKTPEQKVKIDEALLRQYYLQRKRIAKKLHLSEDSLADNLMLLPGVLRYQDQQEFDSKNMIAAFKEGLVKLLVFKEKQGRIIKRELEKNLRGITKNVEDIKRFKNPSSADSDTNGNKDIDEELSLLAFYLRKLEKLLKTKKKVPKGKAIDFLSQEILRELNAASSKIKLPSISWRLVEAKGFLERIREQAQNIE